MKDKLPKLFENAKTLADIFEVVKTTVQVNIHSSRAGLMLGLADLGNNPQGFFGAFHPVDSNIIVMNKIPLQRIKETQPKLWKPYAFYILLHEYLHSLGYLDEDIVLMKVYTILKDTFGSEHPATMIAKDPIQFFPNLIYPYLSWEPDELIIDLVGDFDRSNVSYIS